VGGGPDRLTYRDGREPALKIRKTHDKRFAGVIHPRAMILTLQRRQLSFEDRAVATAARPEAGAAVLGPCFFVLPLPTLKCPASH
jgi:hypothetical protein